MKAVMDDLDEVDKRQESVKKITKACTGYVQNVFKTQNDKNLLADIANGAWDKVCDLGTIESYEISQLVANLYDLKYEDDLRQKCKIKPRQVQKFVNKHMDGIGFQSKLKSSAAAAAMLTCIDKQVEELT